MHPDGTIHEQAAQEQAGEDRLPISEDAGGNDGRVAREALICEERGCLVLSQRRTHLARSVQHRFFAV